MKKISEKEAQAVAKLPADERYEYGIKMIAEYEELYGLRNAKGWVTAKDEEGEKRFVLWPHPGYAQMCAADEWEGATPAKITLDDWFGKWSQKLGDEEMGISFFPVPAGEAYEVTPDQFIEDLEQEMERFE
jgi:hypothetical protein